MMSEPRPTKYWFHAKRYGWGWGLPATWQGWVVMICWLTMVLGATPFLAARHLGLFIGFMCLMGALLIAICYRTGEPPRWRWGK